MTARILVIEDNPANLELMSYLLQAYGYAAITAGDGEEGYAVAVRERPDLILCDIQLPKKSGFELARELKAHPDLGRVPLVAVTAFAMVGDREKLLAAGFDGYIAKPIAPESFVGQIEGFLRNDPHLLPEAVPAPAAVWDVQLASGHHRILVVDNLHVNLELERCILEPLGYLVTTAASMTEALELARRHAPDLIISDVNMAAGSGFDFIRMVKADPLLRSVPFVFMTSTAWDERSRALGLSLGADRFLFRPIEPLALLAEIEGCLRARSPDDGDHPDR